MPGPTPFVAPPSKQVATFIQSYFCRFHGACDPEYQGRFDAIQYMRVHGWCRAVIGHAARYGRIDCLEYLHENGCPWDEEATESAADGGHLDCLKYLHEKGCPWNEGATKFAAANGHLDCLKYLHEKGCPWGRVEISVRCKVYWSIFRDMVKARSVAIQWQKYTVERQCRPGGKRMREDVADWESGAFLEG